MSNSITRVSKVAVAAWFLFASISVGAQQVALLDSGVDPDAGLNIGDGFNYFTNTSDTSDVSLIGHGTISAMAVAEAFNGTIIPFVVHDGTEGNPSQNTVARDNSLSDILGRDQVKVVGITTGFQGIVQSSASLVPQLTNNGKVVAIMAGNDFASQPNALATSSFNLSGAIIVGGTDTDGVLIPAVNKAGTTAEKYVTTIGTPTNTPDATGGSSWAAARIAGIAGAVFQQNPNLTAAEVVEVILESAEDRGATGTDSVYGRGFIANADQVLNNVIGPIEIPTESDTGSGGGGSSGGGGAALLVGGVVAGTLVLLRKPSDKLQKTLVLDSYGRGFQVDLNDHITVDDGILSLNTFLTGLEQKSIAQQVDFPKLNTQFVFSGASHIDERIDMIEYFAMPGDAILQDESADMAVAFETNFDNGLFFGGGYQINPSNYYSADSNFKTQETFSHTSFLTKQIFNSLLSSFSPQANSFDVGYRAKKSGKASVKMGLVTVDQPQRFGLDSLSSIIEGKYQFNDNAAVSLQFGQLEENGSLFGGAAGGLFGVESAVTNAINLSGNLKLNSKISIIANYGMGRTKVDASRNSVLNNFDNIKTNWYSVGLVGNNLFRAQDQLGFAFSQPLKVISGGVDYSIPKHYNADGQIHFDTERVNLADTGATEQVFESYYRTRLNDNLELGSFFSYRHNPNHIKENGDDMMAMVMLRYFH